MCEPYTKCYLRKLYAKRDWYRSACDYFCCRSKLRAKKYKVLDIVIYSVLEDIQI